MSVTLRPKSASNWTWNGPASIVVFANACSAIAAPAMPIRTGPTTWAQRGMRAMAGTVAVATAYVRNGCFSGRLECSFGGRDFPRDLDERLQERGESALADQATP